MTIQTMNIKSQQWGENRIVCLPEDSDYITEVVYYEKENEISHFYRIEDVDGYWKETFMGQVVSICQFNADMMRDGIGYAFNDTTLLSQSIYTNGECKMLVRTFKDDQMTEYGEEEEVVYEGQYEDSLENQYPKSGTGRWFKNDLQYDGLWESNYPNGEGILYHNSTVIATGDWQWGYLKLNPGEYVDYETGKTLKVTTWDRLPQWSARGGKIRPAERITVKLADEFVQYLEVSSTIEELFFVDNSCNEKQFQELNLSEFSKLRSVVMGSNCCSYVERVILEGMSELLSFQVGQGCFSCSNNRGKKQLLLSINGCPVLTELSIGAESFVEFTSFQLNNLTSLETLHIGKLDVFSNCFTDCSSFYILSRIKRSLRSRNASPTHH